MAQQERERNRTRNLARRDDPRDLVSDPYRAIRRMFDQFDRWPFGSPASFFGSRGSQIAGWTPQIDTFQRGDEFVLRADLPGMEKKDVTVEIQDGSLIIRGERSSEQEERDDSYYMTERSYGQFYRVVPLPDGASAESVRASFKNGVLEVTMHAPERTAARGRKVEIAE